MEMVELKKVKGIIRINLDYAEKTNLKYAYFLGLILECTKKYTTDKICIPLEFFLINLLPDITKKDLNDFLVHYGKKHCFSFNKKEKVFFVNLTKFFEDINLLLNYTNEDTKENVEEDVVVEVLEKVTTKKTKKKVSELQKEEIKMLILKEILEELIKEIKFPDKESFIEIMDMLKEFIDYKFSKKKEITERMKNAYIRDLILFSEKDYFVLREVIERCVISKWEKFYEIPKYDNFWKRKKQGQIETNKPIHEMTIEEILKNTK